MALTLTSSGNSLGYRLSRFCAGLHDSGGSPAVGPEGACGTPDGGVLLANSGSAEVYKFLSSADGQSLPSPISATYGMLRLRRGVIYASSNGDANGKIVILNNDGTLSSIYCVVGGGAVKTRGFDFDSVGNLFISSDNGVFKVTASRTVSTLVAGVNGDGAVLSHDGAVFYVAAGRGVVGYSTTDGSVVWNQSVSGGTDGMALPTGTLSGNLIVNCNNGTVVQVQVSSPYTQTVIASGGTRGDHIGYAADGSLYVSQTNEVYRLIPPCGATFSGVAPDVLTGAVEFFNGGQLFSTGRYRILYSAGAYKYDVTHGWTVNNRDSIKSHPSDAGFHVTDGGGNDVLAPGNTVEYDTQALCEAGNAGLAVTYDHIGGRSIGVFLLDEPYADNVGGSPSPTFSICGPIDCSLSASVEEIDVGDSVTLTWASLNADSALDPLGGVTVSGTQSVSPTSTTVYSMAVTGFNATLTKTASVTVTVDRPTAPTLVVAIGQCGGTIALSWSGATHQASYVVERSADGVSWSTVGTPSVATLIDTPPFPGVNYAYRVSSAKGSVTSVPSTTVSASSILSVPSPTGFMVTAKNKRCVLTWDPPVGNYGAVTANVYRGLMSGGEVLAHSGIAAVDGAFTDTGLTNGATYLYRIEFVNECGAGDQSIELSAMPAFVSPWTSSTPPSTGFSPRGC